MNFTRFCIGTLLILTGLLVVRPAGAQVSAVQKISATEGGFSGTFVDLENFGWAVTHLGDMDGDGIPELAVGAFGDDDGANRAGAVWIVFLNAQGQVKTQQKISALQGGFDGTLGEDYFFGAGLASPGDLDGDEVPDLLVGAPRDGSVAADQGAVWILYLNANGTVKSTAKIDQLYEDGSDVPLLGAGHRFGASIAALGSVSGRSFIAVGAPEDNGIATRQGAVWLLTLTAEGTASVIEKITPGPGGILDPLLQDNIEFGKSVAGVGDVDNNGRVDLVVGAPGNGAPGLDIKVPGSVWLYTLNTDGTVAAGQEITNGQGGFTGGLDLGDEFGSAVGIVGDFNRDGSTDLAVGAARDDGNANGVTDRGDVWILSLGAGGTVQGQQQIGGFAGLSQGLEARDTFGRSLAPLGDINRDGAPDFAVGAPEDDDGASDPNANRGAVWIVFGQPPPEPEPKVAEQDSLALVAFYNSTGGASWTDNSGWLSGPVMDWYGISLTETSATEARVTGIDLAENGLAGTLPNTLGDLTALQTLVVSSNALTGSLPGSLGTLKALRVFEASDNQLNGALPEALGTMDALEVLGLSNNLFTGTIPPALGDLSELQELHLARNQFTGQVPNDLTGLDALTILRLQFNRLDGLPNFSSGGASLTSLRIQNNNFTFEDIEPNVGVATEFIYSPQALVGSPRTEQIAEGESLTLQVSVGGSNNTYQWLRNNVAIPGATESSYTITNASPASAGEYTLQIKNTVATELTLVSEPIAVAVDEIVTYSAALSGLNMIPPNGTTANGTVTATLSGSMLTVTGSFIGLSSAYDASHIHAGTSDENGVISVPLSPSVTGRSGTYEAANNTFELNDEQLQALTAGRMYVVVHSIDLPGGELRGQLFESPNSPPRPTALLQPSDGNEFDVQGENDLAISWETADDPDGHDVHYAWQLALDQGFRSVLVNQRPDNGTALQVAASDLDDLLENLSTPVPQGGKITLYHRTISTDGSLFASSATFTIVLARGEDPGGENNLPQVVNPIGDLYFAPGSAGLSVDLDTVFTDPDAEQLTYLAASTEPTVAEAVLSGRNLLNVTPAGVGRTTITVTARDGSDAIIQDIFEVLVNSGPTVVSEIADQTLTTEAGPFTVDLTTVFGDDGLMTFLTESSAPTTASAVILTDGKSLEVRALAVGSATVTVTATDEQDESAMTQFTVQVTEDTIEPPLSFQTTVSLPFANATDSLNYRLVGLPGAEPIPMRQAIPGQPDTTWIAFRDTGGGGSVEQYLQKYDGSANFDFRPGRGFWLLSKQTWQFSETRTSVTLDEEGNYAIPLQNGWNIISNPFDTDVAWSDVQVLNNVPQSSLFRWSGSFASTPTFSTASGGEAFYFNNAQSLTELKIPYRPASSAESERPVRPTLNLTARRQGRTTSLVRIGHRTDAAEDLDRYDQEAPPGYFETASIRLLHTAFDGSSLELAEEYRPSGLPGYRFDLLLRSEPRKTVLLHPDMPDAFSGMDLVLLDTEQGRRYYLTENGTISLTPETKESRFVLLIGDATFIAREQERHLPEAFVLHQNYPNPFNPETTISYALPQGANVRVTVYDALGRQVRELVRGPQEAGYHQVVWDARSDSGMRVASGMYLYRLEAGSLTRVRSMLLLK